MHWQIIGTKTVSTRAHICKVQRYLHDIRFAWAGGTFSPVVLLCQFFVLVENRFWFYILTYVTYHIILRTNIFLIVVEVLAMFFVGFLRRSNYDLKKKYSHLAVGWNNSQITACRVKIQTPPITL